MKILTIIGSPRKKGNSYQAARKLEEEMKKQGDYEFEYLFLKDANLEACRGCFNCISRGIEFCPLKDDRQMIQEKMQEADGLVMVSPVYVMNVTALLKNFIDRVAYLCHRPEYLGKKAMVLCTTGGIGAKETLEYMEMITGAWGYKVAGKCGLTTPPWPATEGLEKKNSKALQKSVQKFDQTLKSMEQGESPKVSIKEYMGFRIFQTISRDVKEYLPADYQFYQGKEYYQPTGVGFLTRTVTGIMLRVIFFMMRDMGPGEKKDQ
ncbi:NAD(P)H-dependent oxidoreductase [uncultured Methanobacterium sp.]|uniref:flavodoxin family protein n=1 Tax=uncultured Methanobacterium sp. TaxID=176306 RepID=UPI002AA701F2|nr:NAD(P)H-dependent oxidoreductase [uncultured Methanobacterium sp.]